MRARGERVTTWRRRGSGQRCAWRFDVTACFELSIFRVLRRSRPNRLSSILPPAAIAASSRCPPRVDAGYAPGVG